MIPPDLVQCRRTRKGERYASNSLLVVLDRPLALARTSEPALRWA
jgi:hypothetical protein